MSHFKTHPILHERVCERDRDREREQGRERVGERETYIIKSLIDFLSLITIVSAYISNSF